MRSSWLRLFSSQGFIVFQTLFVSLSTSSTNCDSSSRFAKTGVLVRYSQSIGNGEQYLPERISGRYCSHTCNARQNTANTDMWINSSARRMTHLWHRSALMAFSVKNRRRVVCSESKEDAPELPELISEKNAGTELLAEVRGGSGRGSPPSGGRAWYLSAYVASATVLRQIPL